MFMNHWKDEKEMDVSSDEEPCDSDQIDSDVEAELYSVIHHETDHSITNCDDSINSSNTSDKENYSSSLHSEEFKVSNANFEKSSQIVSHNNNNNSTSLAKTFTSYLQSSSLKRKSDSDCIVLDNTPSCSKRQKNDSQNNSKTGVLSSSEDDNDIICIGPVDKEKHFETNVSEIVVVDSDSDTADSWCFKSPKISTSTPSTSKAKDLWFVNDEDLYRSRRSSNRYHESQSVTCNLCNQKGHSPKFCTFSKGPKCFICGGKHFFARCKKRICAKCLVIGHDIKSCPKDIDVCDMCQMPGHHQNICPDLWRRFQKFQKNPRVKKRNWRLFQDTPFFCYNCGLPGHFGPLCKGRRMNTLSFSTWPFVLNYKVMNQAKVKSKAKPVINSPNKESSIGNEDMGPIPTELEKTKSYGMTLHQIKQKYRFPRTKKKKDQTESPHDETNSTVMSRNMVKKLRWQEIKKAKRQRKRQRRKERRAAAAKENAK